MSDVNTAFADAVIEVRDAVGEILTRLRDDDHWPNPHGDPLNCSLCSAAERLDTAIAQLDRATILAAVVLQSASGRPAPEREEGQG